MLNFSSQQLFTALKELEKSSFGGSAKLTIETSSTSKIVARTLVLRNGRLVYSYSQSISPQELAQKIGKHFNISIISTAIKTAETKIANPDSFQELFEFLNRMKVITNEQLENFLYQELMLSLEQYIDCAGEFITNSSSDFDLVCSNYPNGWSISDLQIKIQERQQYWKKLGSFGINSSEAIPKLMSPDIQKISSVAAQKHCQEWIDGQRSIREIANEIHHDPLKLAKNYFNWTRQKWIYFGETAPGLEPKTQQAKSSESKPVSKNLPTVLSVDDSPVVQTILKRALNDSYNVILAGNGMEALKILNSQANDIKLILLDVTMPDIDGIELCRTIRRFKKFQDLPIIMLTAKDGMFDKVKGKFAGSTEYLTKPINRETLLNTITKYVPSLAKI